MNEPDRVLLAIANDVQEHFADHDPPVSVTIDKRGDRTTVIRVRRGPTPEFPRFPQGITVATLHHEDGYLIVAWSPWELDEQRLILADPEIWGPLYHDLDLAVRYGSLHEAYRAQAKAEAEQAKADQISRELVEAAPPRAESLPPPDPYKHEIEVQGDL